MSSFLSGGTPDSSICPNGIDFSSNKLFLLVCNHPIAKYEKAYFEFTVYDYKKLSTVNYMPIYVGLHKEPASGTLNNDFCLGSIFYSTDTGLYNVIEKHLKTASTKNTNPGFASTRPPINKEVIGVAINRPKNLITIYREGIKLYSFSPSLFNIYDEDDLFYPALYSNVTSKITGSINFGATGCKYVPNGYTTLFRLHNKTKEVKVLTGHLTVGKEVPTNFAELSGTANVIDIKGDGSLSLLSSSTTNEANGLTFVLNNQLGSIYSSLPLSSKYKIYSEFYVRDGINQLTEYGIPVTIGITDKPSDVYSGHTLRIPLHHHTTTMYSYFEDFDDKTETFYVQNVDTSIPNEEGKYIGIGVDIPNRTVEVWVNKVHFYTYKIKNFTPNNGVYLYIKSDGSFTNYAQGNVNFGGEEFFMELPEGYMSLWHYYNKLNYYPVHNIPEIVCISFTIAEKYTKLNKCLYGMVYVPDDGGDAPEMHKPGLNKLMSTYNRVLDTESYYTLEFTFLTTEEFNKLVANNNNGYYPNNPDDPDTIK